MAEEVNEEEYHFRRNAVLIDAQNLMAIALAKNAWDEGIIVPAWADAMDDNGFYHFNNGSVISSEFPGRVGYVYGTKGTTNSWPILKDEHMSGDVLDSVGDGAETWEAGGQQLAYPLSYNGAIHQGNDNSETLYVSVERTANQNVGDNKVISQSASHGEAHFFFASWLTGGKFRIIDKSAFSGPYNRYDNVWNGPAYISETDQRAMVYVIEVEPTKWTTLIKDETMIVDNDGKKHSSEFETKPYCWYYIAVHHNGLKTVTWGDIAGGETYTPLEIAIEPVIEETEDDEE